MCIPWQSSSSTGLLRHTTPSHRPEARVVGSHQPAASAREPTGTHPTQSRWERVEIIIKVPGGSTREAVGSTNGRVRAAREPIVPQRIIGEWSHHGWLNCGLWRLLGFTE